MRLMNMRLHTIISLITLLLFFAGCDGPTGSVSIQVIDVFGHPLSGARLTVKRHSRETDHGGWAMLDRAPVGRYTIEVMHPGYLPSYRTLEIKANETVTSRVMMQPYEQREFRPDKKNLITGKGIEIEIPAHAFETSKKELTIRFASVDVSGPALEAMPGEFAGRELTGQSSQIESFGVWNIAVFEKEKDGSNEKELQPVKPVTVRVPLHGKPDGKSIPLWSFDTETGLWIEQGAVVIGSRSGKDWGRADLKHFSWWNIDQPIRNKVAIWVQSFEDETGAKLFTPSMSGRGKDYNGISYPYDLYSKPAVAVPGSCIDVKPGAAIDLNAFFADSDGYYAYSAEMATPTGGSSCQLNPEAGVVIPVLKLKRHPSVCVRGRVKIKDAKSSRFEIYLGAHEMFRRHGKTDRDGSFCINHVPTGIKSRLMFSETESTWNFLSRVFSPFAPLEAQSHSEGRPYAYFTIEPDDTAAFTCERSYQRCYDVGLLEGSFGLPWGQDEQDPQADRRSGDTRR